MTGITGALHRRVWRGAGPRVRTTPASVPAVRFKDLGVLPVCGGSVRPLASQRANAARADRP
jgi:hypothetical protein